MLRVETNRASKVSDNDFGAIEKLTIEEQLPQLHLQVKALQLLATQLAEVRGKEAKLDSGALAAYLSNATA